MKSEIFTFCASSLDWRGVGCVYNGENKMKDSKIVASYDAACCFPRPHESLHHYLHDCQPLLRSQGKIPEDIVQLFAQKFYVDIESISVERSSKGLWPWELACCLIEDKKPVVQIRPACEAKAVLCHELIHAARCRLDSPLFEEHIAYAATAVLFPRHVVKWRAWLSPIFPNSRVVIITLLQTWIWWTLPVLFDLPFFLGLGFLFFPLWLLYRLTRRWATWNKAFSSVALYWPRAVWPLFLRLHDEDIVWLSNLPNIEVVSEVHKRAHEDWRWAFFLEQILEV